MTLVEISKVFHDNFAKYGYNVTTQEMTDLSKLPPERRGMAGKNYLVNNYQDIDHNNSLNHHQSSYINNLNMLIDKMQNLEHHGYFQKRNNVY